GGIDAGEDAGHDAGGDAGPMCTLACEPGDMCCVEADGVTEVCAALRNDPHHCGTCPVDCFATNRGDGCSANQCTCGPSTIGCTGGRESFCCPSPAPGADPYCANLDTSPGDCGGCGIGCARGISSHCDGGRCVCDAREPCLGTPDSM